MWTNMFLFILLFFFLNFCSELGNTEVNKVADPVIHGEGPHWDKEKQVLYYVDITNQTLVKYDPSTEAITKAYLDGGPVSLVVPDKFDEKKFVIGRGLDILSVTWDGKSPKPSQTEILASVDPEKPFNRFNDGKADASGRLWAGTMGPENPNLLPHQGSLYSFDWSEKFKPKKHLSPVSVSNGIAWSKNDSLMYYVDSPTKIVNAFNFDIVNGVLSNRRELFNLEKNGINGLPDGMTIDENENLWLAVYNGGCILCIDTREGKLLNKIAFPVTKVTSCAFGGDDLQDLYVTSSRVGLSDEELKKQPLAGALFKVTGLNVRGQDKPNTIRLP